LINTSLTRHDANDSHRPLEQVDAFKGHQQYPQQITALKQGLQRSLPHATFHTDSTYVGIKDDYLVKRGMVDATVRKDVRGVVWVQYSPNVGEHGGRQVAQARIRWELDGPAVDMSWQATAQQTS
jgi:hypothetical protein